MEVSVGIGSEGSPSSRFPPTKKAASRSTEGGPALGIGSGWLPGHFGGDDRVYLNAASHLSADVPEVTLRTHLGVRLQGRVTGLRGMPCKLIVDYSHGKRRQTTIHPETGAYEISGLESGIVKVQVCTAQRAPLKTIHEVWVDPSFPQDARLSNISVSHNYRAIEVRAEFPWERSPLTVRYKATGAPDWPGSGLSGRTRSGSSFHKTSDGRPFDQHPK